MANIGALTIVLGVDDKGLLQAQVRVKQFADEAQKQGERASRAIQRSTSAAAVGMQNMFVPFQKQTIAALSQTAQRLRTFGYLASATLTAPIVFASRAVTKLASDYEFAMQKIVGLTGTAQATVNEWSKDVIAIGKEFGRKPQELAEGLYFIVSSGIHGSQALNALRLSAKAAASGLGDLTDIADYLTSTLNAYRGTGLTAAHAIDVLVAGVREGKAEAAGFATAMGSVIPIASQLGVNIDQVAGAMAAITLTGSNAAKAATYLRGVFNALLKESDQGTEAMQEASQALGMMSTSFADLRKILREQGIMALMERLNKLTAAYGETLVAKVFPNIRAMLGVLSLSGKNMEYNSRLVQRVADSQGSLAKAFNAVSDTIKLRYDKALVKLQTSFITLGKSVAETILPLFEKLVNAINKVVDWFNSLSEAQKRNKIRWALFAAAIGPATLALSLFYYSVVGTMNVVNALSKAITKLNTVMAIFGLTSARAGAKFGLLRKVVAARNWSGTILGGLGKLIKNPYVLVTAGTIAATVAIGKYAKKIKQVAADNELYNKSLVKVDDSIKKFKDLTNIDYEVMSLDELKAAQEQARKVWDDAYKLYKQYQKNISMPLQSERLNKKLMEDQAKKIEFAKDAYDSLSEAIKQYEANIKAQNLEEEKKKQEEIARAIKERQEALKKEWATMLADLSTLKELAKIYGEMGKPFDLAQEKADLFFKTIERLTGGDYRLKFDSSEIQTLIGWLKVLNIDFSELGQITKKYNEELAEVKMKSFLLGSAFNAESAKLQIYQKHLDDLIEVLSKRKPEDISLINKKDIEETLRLIDKTQIEIEKITDKNQLRLLQAEANAFGNIAGQVEVLNYAISAEERYLRRILKVFIEGSKTGEVVTWKQIQEATKRIQELKIAYVEAQNAMDLQFLNDLNNVLQNTATGSDLLDGKIKALENTLRVLSEQGKGSTEEFKNLAKQMQKLRYAEDTIQILSDSFTDFFEGIISGAKNMGDVMKGIFNNIINEVVRLISQLIALKLVMTFLGLNIGGKIPTDILNRFTNMAPLLAAASLAKGGIVPPGYPNDTYPARLSSGEAVIPLENINKLNLQPSVAVLEGKVEFEIEGTKLKGVLRKIDKKNSIY